MIARFNVVVMVILDTRVSKQNFGKMWTSLSLVHWNMEHNYLKSDQGRIWIVYDTRYVKLLVKEVSTQFIHCEITWGDEIFYWTCIYGSFDPEVRRKLWRDLVRIGKNLNAPWLM